MDVKVEIIHTTNASENGAISFKVEGQSGSKDYSIYKVTPPPGEQNQKVKPSYQFNGLAAGIYEFVVIDHKREKCTKEVQVKIEQK
ncbi:MAG: hypothetical protein HYR67_11695 [Bacteroidetes bacterium]|nr:hypothetical protein [Bacteroidota bacterium]